jgi:aspartyl-tRNA(Asn)/glutamyl-tRNA(Gln) amidotransferase subunit A
MAQTLDRIDAINPAINAIVALRDRDALLHEAERAPTGPLQGLPMAIKDLAETKGIATSYGSPAFRDHVPAADSPMVARLRRAGAVIIGKTTTPEFGWKGVTDSALTGITRNPWDPTRTPGGSSGGAAVAAAAGFGALHVGSDGGGSIRMPCGFTGVFGIKPTFGRVPHYPQSPMGTVTHVGPMTRTVADSALMLSVLARPDDRDWFAVPWDGRDYRIGLEDGIAGLRIAYSPDLGYAKVEPEVAALVDAAVARLVDLGAVVERADPPFADPHEMFKVHWFGRFHQVVSRMSPEKQALVDPGLRETAALGARYGTADFIDAEMTREAMGRGMAEFHRRYDLLVTPQLPLPAFEAGLEFPPGKGYTRWIDWSPFTLPFNFTQQPAATVPCGLTAAGLPVALQVVGPRFADALVLRAARACESIAPFPMPDLARTLG